jgi:hypothetical protein
MREFDGAPIANAPATSQRLSDIRVSIPAEILAYPELRIPNAAAQTRIVSKARIRLDSGKSVRSFKGIICADISEFESYMPSHAVRSL